VSVSYISSSFVLVLQSVGMRSFSECAAHPQTCAKRQSGCARGCSRRRRQPLCAIGVQLGSIPGVLKKAAAKAAPAAALSVQRRTTWSMVASSCADSALGVLAMTAGVLCAVVEVFTCA
jgi:hypothetical protein